MSRNDPWLLQTELAALHHDVCVAYVALGGAAPKLRLRRRVELPRSRLLGCSDDRLVELVGERIWGPEILNLNLQWVTRRRLKRLVLILVMLIISNKSSLANHINLGR